MHIPRLFGNKIVLVVIALALILITIISLINIGKIAFTGFSSLEDKFNEDTNNQQNIPNTGSSSNNGEGSALSILVMEGGVNFTNTSFDTSSNTPSNKLSNPSGTRRSRGHNGGGSTPNEENSIDNENNEANNPINNPTNNPDLPVNLKRKLTKKPKNLDLKIGDTDIGEGEEFEGIIRLNIRKSNRKISAFDINFTEDIDLSDILADSDFFSGKVFMHSHSGRLKNIDLYVPVKEGIDSIVICSNASSYDEIYYGCSNNSHITKEEILPLTSPRIELSSDGLYYIIHGITGTGAVGVNVTNISSGHQNATPPGNVDAFAGNITHIAVPEGTGITQAWAGYYGNVTGTIMLADSSDNVMYNWSLSSPEGEVFASTNNSIVWNHVQCFNFTASGTYTDESGNGGSTNLYGTNLTILEAQYNIRPADLDGVDETFLLSGMGTHNTFYVNANEFIEGECQNTRIADSSGFGKDDHFEEVLMYEPTTYSVIFAALLNENVLGFDNREHDFEMIVLEDGHLTDTETTTYYFYAVIY